MKIPTKMNTPWGESQTVDLIHVIDGRTTYSCYWVTTAGHGGIMIPRALAILRIPFGYRKRQFVRACVDAGESFECYEEDCEWSTAVHFIPELAKHSTPELESLCRKAAEDMFTGWIKPAVDLEKESIRA